MLDTITRAHIFLRRPAVKWYRALLFTGSAMDADHKTFVGAMVEEDGVCSFFRADRAAVSHFGERQRRSIPPASQVGTSQQISLM